mmetsp:Transcript_7716/g.13940  ORF Transcript_7716/g.13940 Transcript_7716/m.13940 type:complete len:110 (+) Transcript_7716:282-611(+)
MVAYYDLAKPLALAVPRVAGDNGTHWEAVVAWERIPVHFIGENGFAKGIHSLVHGDATAIAEASLVYVVTKKLKMKLLPKVLLTERHGIHLHAAMSQDIAHFYTTPLGS